MPIAENGSATVYAKAGDVVDFDTGEKITVISDLSGLGFYIWPKNDRWV